MMCDICKKNPATVYLTQTSEGRPTVKFELCEHCARARGVSDPAGFALANLLDSLGAHEPAAKGTKYTENPSGDPI